MPHRPHSQGHVQVYGIAASGCGAAAATRAEGGCEWSPISISRRLGCAFVTGWVALDASGGRRRRRKRNTSPDSIGMAIKRRLLEVTVQEDPEPDEFEGWLLGRPFSSGRPDDRVDSELFVAIGLVRAISLEVLAEWRLVEHPGAFRNWLPKGAFRRRREAGLAR